MGVKGEADHASGPPRPGGPVSVLVPRQGGVIPFLARASRDFPGWLKLGCTGRSAPRLRPARVCGGMASVSPDVLAARLLRGADRVSLVVISFIALAALAIGVAVAGHAVVDVADAFLQMFADQVGFLMLVTAEAGELAELVCGRVATGAGNMLSIWFNYSMIQCLEFKSSSVHSLAWWACAISSAPPQISVVGSGVS